MEWQARTPTPPSNESMNWKRKTRNWERKTKSYGSVWNRPTRTMIVCAEKLSDSAGS